MPRRAAPTILIGLALAPLSAGCAVLPPPPPPPPPEPIAVAAPSPPAEGPARARDPLEVLEEGSWTARDPGSEWYLRYRFRGGRYTTSGHPTWAESGRVEVVRQEGRRLVLRFVERVYDGHEDEPLEQELELAEDEASFVMGGRRFVYEGAIVVAEPTGDEDDAPPSDAP